MNGNFHDFFNFIWNLSEEERRGKYSAQSHVVSNLETYVLDDWIRL
jgi:hypothetical protein